VEIHPIGDPAGFVGRRIRLQARNQETLFLEFLGSKIDR